MSEENLASGVGILKISEKESQSERKFTVYDGTDENVSHRIWLDDAFFLDDKSKQWRYQNLVFLDTFPCSHVDGRLPLYQVFSLLKCDIAFRYNRLRGKKVRLPFRLSCTNVSTKRYSDKLKREMETYGYPPKFPEKIKNEEVNGAAPENESKKKKNKANIIKYQWQIMQTLGLQDEEIKKFTDPAYWLEYFPLLDRIQNSNRNFIDLSVRNYVSPLVKALDEFALDGTRLYLVHSEGSIRDDHDLIIDLVDKGTNMMDEFVQWATMLVDNTYMKDYYFPDGYADLFDKLFINELNLKIRETEEYYSKRLYREAVRTGFYEFQKAGISYMKMSPSPKMSVIQKYVKTQCILLFPICPLVCAKVWDWYSVYADDFSKSYCIINEEWCEKGEINDILTRSFDVLIKSVDKFKILQEEYETIKRLCDGTDIHTEREGIIWIAKTYSPWQSTILSTMREIYLKNGNELPDDEELFTMFESNADLGKFMNEIMPFVHHVKIQMKAIGLNALNLTLGFDEFKLFKDSMLYLHRELNFCEIVIKYIDEASEETKEECYPGAPCITFSYIFTIPLKLINLQKEYKELCNIYNIEINKTVSPLDIVSYIAKKCNIKDPTSVVLYRYDNPNLESTPIAENILDGKTEIPSNAVFTVNIEEDQMVEVDVADETYPIGRGLIYVINSSEEVNDAFESNDEK